MKLVLKKVTLKEDTEKDIAENSINTDIFIERIGNYLEKGNYLVNNKMLNFEKEELYYALNKVFNIYFEPRDYLKILSRMNEKHYTKFINVKTNMCNEKGNINYFCAVSYKEKINDNDRLDLNKLRKLTNANDLLVLKKEYSNEEIKHQEKYENHQYIDVDINNKTIDENSELFTYATSLLKDEIKIKDVLYDLKLYFDEVIYQVRCITKLAFVEKNDQLASIGKQYKRTYDLATNYNVLPKKEKISVYHHKKVKKR